MNIDTEILKALIKNSFSSTTAYLENVLTENDINEKIEFLDYSIFNENDDFIYHKVLEVSHIYFAFQNYYYFLEDKEDIQYLINKGTKYVTNFSNDIFPYNFDNVKIFLDSFLDIEVSNEAICYFSPYIEIIEPKDDYKKILLDIFNKYIKEEKSLSSNVKYYINIDSTSKWSQFEKLSKEHKIILSTSLDNKPLIFFIMKLFRIIYDKKYYLLNNFEYFHKYLSKNKISIDILDEKTLLSKLDNINFTNYISESEIIPNITVSDSRSKQKVFTLKDIKKLIK